jgi:5''-methylthioadenosine/S-adenosylhomocysteine nucleosidase
MARFGIISAMPVELEGFIKAYGAKELGTKGFYKVYEGSEGENEIFMACSGVGKVNAAACTQRLIDCFDIDFLINMGIAGGISKELKALDVVIGRAVVYHDFTPDSLLDKYYPFSRIFNCDESLVQTAERVCESLEVVKRYSVGVIASGDCFVEKSETKAHILELGGSCCEMEGAAIGHVARLNGVPFIVIRTISDLADENAEMSYEEFERKASEQSNLVVSGILKAIAE